MENVCDICGQSFAGLMFSGRNEEGEREERRICFFCIAKCAGVNFAEAEREASAASSVTSDIIKNADEILRRIYD